MFRRRPAISPVIAGELDEWGFPQLLADIAHAYGDPNAKGELSLPLSETGNLQLKVAFAPGRQTRLQIIEGKATSLFIALSEKPLESPFSTWDANRSRVAGHVYNGKTIHEPQQFKITQAEYRPDVFNRIQKPCLSARAGEERMAL